MIGDRDFLNLPVRVQASQEGGAARAQGDRQSRGERGEQGLEARSRMHRARAGAAGRLNDVNGAQLKTRVEGKSECLA